MITLDEVKLFASDIHNLPKYHDDLSRVIDAIEWMLRDKRAPRTDAVITDKVKLAWSGARRHWRFLVIDEEDSIELLRASWEERLEVFESGAMVRLLERALAAVPPTRSVRSRA